MSETAPVEELLKTLPSRTEYYDKFKNGGGIRSVNCSNEGECGKEVTSYQLNSTELRRYEHDIRTALNYIYTEYRNGTKKSLESTARHFLYYWIGEKFSKITDGSFLFQAKISTICGYINRPSEKGPFGIPCDNPNRETFLSRKKIFDYSYDYSTVIEKISDGAEGKDKWSAYLEGITTACKVVREDCTRRTAGAEGEDGRAYCKEFETRYGAYCEAAKLPDLESKLGSLESEKLQAERAKQSTLSQLNEAESKASAASSLSSAFGTLALLELPAVLFILYKHKPWSSWLGNHFSGNGRNARRKRAIGQDLDDLTETSTVAFTGSSEGSSTFDPTTVRSSTAYTRQLTRGREGKAGRAGTGINNTPGDHRNNIGYQNM